MKTGYIYKITNNINQKVYIGQTRQKPKNRWLSHKSCHKSKPYPLYNAMRKYGIENFSFDVIEENIQLELLTERENHWIKEFNSIPPGHGYNITKGKNSNKNPVKKKVFQYSLDGKFLREFESVADAASEYNTRREKIRACFTQRAYSVSGFIWKDKLTTITDEEKELAKTKIPILQYALDGTFIREHESTLDACYALDKKKGNGDSAICAVLRGRERSIYGFIWKYKTDNYPLKIDGLKPLCRKVAQYSKDGKFIKEFKSITEAAKQLGSVGTIHNCCSGKIKSAYGYIWKFV